MRSGNTIIFAGIGIAAAAAAVTFIPPRWTPETVRGSEAIVIDGDTVHVPCILTGPLGCRIKIRLEKIDTPETWEPRCEAERIAGEKAKARLAELIRAETVTVSSAGKKDRYGRTLADLSVPAGDVGQILIREGLALPYQPGSEARAARISHWCKDQRS